MVEEVRIVRDKDFGEKIVIVDGQPGCGKTLLAGILPTLNRVEMINYAFEIEYICRLSYLKKIGADTAAAMACLLSDFTLYHTMMGRNSNFRYGDISSVFKSANKWRYIKRIFQKGDMHIPERIKKERPILLLTTHDLLSSGGAPIFSGIGKRLIFIEVIRHPLYMLMQQKLNFERLLNNARDLQINFDYKGEELPWFANGWEKLFVSSNDVEKAIYTIERMTKLSDMATASVKERHGGQVLTIPFENFVLDPWPFMEKVANALESRVTTKTRRVMKKQNVPRKKISDGIPLDIYKRCGWESPEKDLNEQQELDKRRQYAIDQGASKEAMEVLDRICSEYEEKFFHPISDMRL